MKKTALRALVAATALSCSLSALAASDGDVGSSNSSGTTEITLEVGNLIVVRNLKDIDLTTAGTAAGSDITGSETLCVGGLGFTGYTVQLDSTNGGASTGTYELGNGTDTITYQVAFDDDTASASGTAPDATTGSVATTFSNLGTLSCSADNARIFVTIPAAQWETISDTTNLTDTLTVTVAGS